MNTQELLVCRGRKIIFLNIRSLSANINLLRHDFEMSDVMAIGLSETWLNPKLHDSLFNLQGFKLVRLDRPPPKRGGGLAFYINDAITDYQVPDDCIVSSEHIEMFSVLVKPPFQKTYFITLVYLPPSGNRAFAVANLITVLSPLYSNNKNNLTVIGGDFNMDTLAVDKNTKLAYLTLIGQIELKFSPHSNDCWSYPNHYAHLHSA